MNSFKQTIYFHREKEDNWDIQGFAEEKGFSNSEDMVYVGYELEMEVDIREDLRHKVLSIQGVDVSDKEIYI